MEYLTSQIKKEISAHAAEEEPNECCGIIFCNANNSYRSMKCENVSKEKSINFRIKPADYLKATNNGDIKAYYHSHIIDKVGKFSQADKKISRSHGIPLILYCISNGKFFEFNE